ncbi:MAG: prepilin-type N-terminal cleavage/methylation domain-containing protein [Candidatus Omnitrophica bacterium]|nr:prepilin-type N-terminal cleavage/methylation domain-containing protein [Candidatus Omnitrophota bacterium]
MKGFTPFEITIIRTNLRPAKAGLFRTGFRGFSLLEVLVSTAILGFLIAGIYGVLNIGNMTYNTDLGLLDLQQNARQAMHWMVRELRESASSEIVISEDSSQITFNTPNEGGIQYYYDTQENQIIREYPAGTTRILANNIESLNFSLNGSLLEIQVRARKTQRPDLTLFFKEQVRLRNE